MSDVTGSQLLDEQLAAAPSPTDDAEVAAFRARAHKTAYVPLSRIKKSDVALRGVQRNSEKYMLLLDSVKRKGILNSILVREQIDPETKTMFYGLIDGLQRFTAANDAGLTDVPVNIVEMDDAEVLEAQLVTNLNRIETKPADVSKHLLRMLARNSFMTKAELAARCSQSLTWVEQRLGLADLKDEIKALVNDGKIHLTNAYALSKIDESEQMQHVEAAVSESPKTFVPRMKQRAKEIKDAHKTGGDAKSSEFTPVQHLQKTGDIKKEYAEGCPTIAALLAKNKVTDPMDAVKLAIAWTLHFDADSQEEQKREDAARKLEREQEKARLKEQKEKEKSAKAAAVMESVDKGWA